MKYWIAVVGILFLTSIPSYAISKKEPQFGPVNSITVEGLQRKYDIHFPKGSECQSNLPLVIVLHGAKGSYKKSEGFTGFNQVADHGRFIVAYPNAYNTQWNDGRKKGDTPSYNVDDIHFLTILMEHLAKKYAVDHTRIYLVGFSSGGMMAQRFAMEKTDKIAGIVAIASSIPVPQMEKHIQPIAPIPVMMINGTEDPAFPWNGGKTRFAGIRVGAVSPIETTFHYWIDANGGQAKPLETVALPDVVQDGTHVEKITVPTVAGPEVVLYKIYGGGHSWPGARYPITYLPRFLYGRTSQQFNGSEAAWNFLKNYSIVPKG